MGNKRIILLIGLLLILAGLIGAFLIEREIQTTVSGKDKAQNVTNKAPSVQKKKASEKQDETRIKTDLYSETPFNIPLVSIAEISNLPANTKQTIDNLLENSQGFYLLKQNPKTKEVFILLQNPVNEAENKYQRHNLQIAKIDSNGHITYSSLGYEGHTNEIENAVQPQKNEEWIFDETVEPYRPLKHTVYDKKKKIVYSESWNYDESNPVKYEMQNSNNNVVSVMKETLDGDSGYRQEHIFYDNEGKIIKSMTSNYDGADIKWFTYFDEDNPENTVTIEFEYNDGLKTGEKVYNNEYKLVETLNAEYKDGERTGLKVLDSEGKEVKNYENR